MQMDTLLRTDPEPASVADHPSKKTHGEHYTPPELSDFVARRSLAAVAKRELVVLDPACGDGELLRAVAAHAELLGMPAPHLVGVDRDERAVANALGRLGDVRAATIDIQRGDFLAAADETSQGQATYDLVISNPPYVRTQVLGAARAQALAQQFGLTGRVDLYHAFVAAMTGRLNDEGVLGLLCSNRFLMTKGGFSLRSLLLKYYELDELWDLGDTKLFDAAVLPAVVIARRAAAPRHDTTQFVRVYEHSEESSGDAAIAAPILDVLDQGFEGLVQVGDRRFQVERGELIDAHADRPWRLTSSSGSEWFATVKRHSAGCFGDIGPVRVGIKTTADSVFIRATWDDLPPAERPEDNLIHPLLTHRVAERWRAHRDKEDQRWVLYPHEVRDGRRQAIDLARFPHAARYLQRHRERLEGREYVRKSGRAWYEIWVPQQPNLWSAPKVVWPDISDRPRFFWDDTGAIVNGDCYWMSCGDSDDEEISVALAVANSSFALRHYDLCCGNRLYGGRRRFITQYVQGLPLPRVSSAARHDINEMVGRLKTVQAGEDTGTGDGLEAALDAAVWELFGLKKVAG